MKNLLVCLLVVSTTVLTAQEVDLGKLHGMVANARVEHKVPGLAIGIIKDGEIEFQQGYGLVDANGTDKVKTTSMFGIASLSKAFTAAAMGMLVDEGKIKWTDKVVDILPEWQLSDPAVTAMFTIEDLLCHRSGLKTFDGDLLWYGSNYNRDEIITRVRHLPLSYDFRAGFGYQNIMYITAGQVIEKVSGMSWDDFVKSRILSPLGMNKTNTTISAYNENTSIALPHLKGSPQKLIDYNNSGATAAMNSNVVDMEKWITFLLNNGIYEGDTLLRARTLRKMWSVLNPMNPGGFDKSNGTKFKGYGMGWFLMDYNDVKVIHHGGGLPGYITKVALVPEKNLGIVILTNDMSSVCTALMYEIIDLYTGKEDGRDYSKEFAGYAAKRDSLDAVKLAKENEARKMGTTPGADMASFVGTYKDDYYGNATIQLIGKGKKARLELVLEPAKELFTASLEHWENDKYVFQFNDQFLPRGFANFVIEGGQVKSFTIDLPNPDFHFSNLNFVKE